MKIPNLYSNRDILLFKECFATEKIHGSSAHLTWIDKKIEFFSGGAKYENFVKLFDVDVLTEKFLKSEVENFIIYGEVYCGKMQGMRETYGDQLKFVVFDVRIGMSWLKVPDAEKFVKRFSLDFVHYVKIETDINVLDAWRDADSVQAIKNGMGQDKKREGIVLRPLIEVRTNNGQRIIAKHKRLEFSEVKTPRKIDSEKLKVLEDARQISEEFVTENRLSNICSHLSKDLSLEDIPLIIKLMVEDVFE